MSRFWLKSDLFFFNVSLTNHFTHWIDSVCSFVSHPLLFPSRGHRTWSLRSECNLNKLVLRTECPSYHLS